jgi:Flp pilus assembly protein TadD
VAVDEAVDGLVVGHRLMAAGEYELALRAYFRAAASRAPTPTRFRRSAPANLRLGRLGQAEQALRRALERDPEFVRRLNNLGVVMSEQGAGARRGTSSRRPLRWTVADPMKSATTCDLRSQSSKIHAIVE